MTSEAAVKTVESSRLLGLLTVQVSKLFESIGLYTPKYVNVGPVFKYWNFPLTVEEEWRGRTGRRHGNVTLMWFVCFLFFVFFS